MGNLQNQRQNGAGQRGGAVIGGDWKGGGWRMGGGWVGQPGGGLEAEGAVRHQLRDRGLGNRESQRDSLLHSAPQGQANPTSLLCFFLTINFKCSHL